MATDCSKTKNRKKSIPRTAGNKFLGSAPGSVRLGLSSARPGPTRPGSARLGLARPGHKVGVLRRRNSMFAKNVSFRVDETTSPPNHRHTRFQSQENKSISRRRDATLFCVVDFYAARIGSARLGSAGLGSALPPKVGVSRRRDGNLSKKVASRVDETTLAFGSVRFA